MRRYPYCYRSGRSFIAAGISTAAELLSNAVKNEMTGTAGCIEDSSTC